MQTYIECLPCLVRQMHNLTRLSTDDAARAEQGMREVLRRMSETDWTQPPPRVAMPLYGIIHRVCGCTDPYAVAKRESNREALALLPHLRERIAASADPLALALRAALAGNIIDFGVPRDHPVDLAAEMEKALTEAPRIDDTELLRSALGSARRILYLADNAGEIVLDRLLIEQLGPERVTVVVKSGPIINDALVADAEEAGLTDLVRVIESGVAAPGTLLEQCSAEFKAAWDCADLIISKGQGNYETLCDVGDDRVFFLLKAKCPVVERMLGVPLGSHVLRRCPAGEPAYASAD